MASSLAELLQPQVILKVISRLRPGWGPLAPWLGWQPDSYNTETVRLSGPNTLDGISSVRNVAYRIFDYTRVPMKARAPGTGPATVAANPMGQNTVSVARYHQKIPLLYEFLGNLSPMVGPNSNVDAGGQNYIAQQTKFLTEQANNMLEMMAAGMMRDSLYFIEVGDNWLPTFTAPTGTQVGFQVPFKIPAGNKNQLNMTGTGNIIDVPWDNQDAPIIKHLQAIRAGYAQVSRYPLSDAWINSLMWYNIVTNTSIRNTAGTANTPFDTFEYMNETGMQPGPANRASAILRGDPNIEWHICDDTLALGVDVDPSYSTAPASVLGGTTLNKEIPDGLCIFTTRPSRDWELLYHGGEYVVENPGQPGQLRMGWYFWHEYVTQPAAIELIGLLNAVPQLFVPGVIAPATVTGFATT